MGQGEGPPAQHQGDCLVLYFRKEFTVVEARQFINAPMQAEEVAKWCGADLISGRLSFTKKTGDWDWSAASGDWVVKDVDGEFYPLPEDVFHKIYKQVEPL